MSCTSCPMAYFCTWCLVSRCEPPTYANCFVSFRVSPFSSFKLACDSSLSLATRLDLELPRRLVFHLDLNIALWREVHVTQKANGTYQGSEASLNVQNSQIPSRLHEQQTVMGGTQTLSWNYLQIRQRTLGM